MREDYRLFSCARCHCQVAICSYCDRGQWYCSEACSQQARRARSRAAGRRYQATPKGRRNHAARQERHRKRLRATPLSTEEVTHRGTPTPEAEIRLRSTIAGSPSTVRCKEAGEVGEEARADWVLCDFCGARCEPFARREPLRCRRRRRTTNKRGSRDGHLPRAGSGRPAREPARRPR
jgi:hypothetical protein